MIPATRPKPKPEPGIILAPYGWNEAQEKFLRIAIRAAEEMADWWLEVRANTMIFEVDREK